jgi:hypothetical protein
MTLVEAILTQMSSITKPQRTFLIMVFTTLMYLPGKANFRNLSRYSDGCEKTYSRWFRRPFDFLEFNRISLHHLSGQGRRLAVATDCSYCPKSGRHTFGLDYFYNSTHQRAEKGLEISTLALIDLDYHTSYHLSTRQTPKLDHPKETRIDEYLRHLQADRAALPPEVRHVLADGHYSKIKFIKGVRELGLHQIGRLREDAHLRWHYHGPQKPRGARKRYDGKVRLFRPDLVRFDRMDTADGIQLYTAVVNSVAFKCDIRIVYLVKIVNNTWQTALLFSTDTELSALELYQYYKARFQIEFLFRDAKQFTGLCDVQARSEPALHFHFNASMTALNLLKLEDRQHTPDDRRSPISIASWKIRKFNEHLLERFSSLLGLNFTLIKSHPMFASLCNYGAIAA